MDSEPNCNAVSSMLSSPLALDFLKTPNAILYFCCCSMELTVFKTNKHTKQYLHFLFYVIAMSLFVKLPRQKLGEEGFLRGDSASPHWQTVQTASRWQGVKSSRQFLCWYISQRGQSSRRHISASKVSPCPSWLMLASCHRGGGKRLKDQWHSPDVKYSRDVIMTEEATGFLVSNYSMCISNL